MTYEGVLALPRPYRWGPDKPVPRAGRGTVPGRRPMVARASGARDKIGPGTDADTVWDQNRPKGGCSCTANAGNTGVTRSLVAQHGGDAARPASILQSPGCRPPLPDVGPPHPRPKSSIQRSGKSASHADADSVGEKEGGGGGGSPQTSWQLARSIDFSPLTKIHQAAVLAHRFYFSIDGGPWHQHITDPHTVQQSSSVWSLPRRRAPQLYRSINSCAALTSSGLHRRGGGSGT